MNALEKREAGFARSASQNDQEAVGVAGGGGRGGVGGTGIAPPFFLLFRRTTEFGDLPRLGSKYVAAEAWISLQNK